MLCKKCKAQSDRHGFLEWDWIHCHHDEEKNPPWWFFNVHKAAHEEKPKEKCWCDGVSKRIQKHRYVVDKFCLGHYEMMPPSEAKFCPDCGKELK